MLVVVLWRQWGFGLGGDWQVLGDIYGSLKVVSSPDGYGESFTLFISVLVVLLGTNVGFCS